MIKINMLLERTSLRTTGRPEGRAVRPDLQNTAEKMEVVTAVPRPQSTRKVFLVKQLGQEGGGAVNLPRESATNI